MHSRDMDLAASSTEVESILDELPIPSFNGFNSLTLRDDELIFLMENGEMERQKREEEKEESELDNMARSLAIHSTLMSSLLIF